MVALTRMTAQPVTLPAIRTRTRQRERLGLTAYALLLPSAVFLLGFTYWPVLQVIRGSADRAGLSRRRALGSRQLQPPVRRSAFLHRRHQQLDLCRRHDRPQPGPGAAVRAGAEGNHPPDRRAAHPGGAADADPAGRRGRRCSPSSSCRTPDCWTTTWRRSAWRRPTGWATRRWRWARSSPSPSGRTPATTCCSSSPGSPAFRRTCWTRQRSTAPGRCSGSSASPCRCWVRPWRSCWSSRR